MRISVTLGRAIHHLLKSLLLLLTTLSASHAAPQLPDTILFGVAYYDEYTPVDRIDERRHAGEADPGRQVQIGDQRMKNRRRLRKAGRFQDDAPELRQRAGIATAENVAQPVD